MQSVNLMPQGYAQAERSKRRLLISSAVVIAVVLAMIGCARLIGQRVGQREEMSGLLEERLADLKLNQTELARYNHTLEQLARRYVVVQTVNRNRRWASYLAKLAAAANDEIVLTRADIRPVEPTVEAPKPGSLIPDPAANEEAPDKVKPRKLVLRLEGLAASATDITRFIGALNEAGIFEKVTFKGSRTAQLNGKSLSKFELECPIRYTPRRPAVRPAGPPSIPLAANTPTVLSKVAPAMTGGDE